MTGFDSKALRNAFGSFPTGVTVVTAVGDDGTPVGFTANSFTSVSLNPPMLLVCPGRGLNSYPIFERCTRFAVNVLAEGQEGISNIFASFQGDRFSAVPWRADHGGVPLIEGAAAQFSCRTQQMVEAGDHVILIGEVDAFEHSGLRGLGYAAGGYFSLGLERAAAETPYAGRRTFAGALAVHDGKVLLSEGPDGLSPPKVEIDRSASVRHAVADWFAAHGAPIRLGKAYSIFDGRGGEQFTYFLAEAEIADPGSVGRFVPIGDLAQAKIASAAEKAMLDRFALETRTQSFGFYVGDSVSGYVHALNTGSDEKG